MPTLLHISDLHRTSDPHMSNDDLLSAIFSDSARWKSEGIPWPDLIVVSGDLIQGVKTDAYEPNAQVLSQYTEVSALLQELAAKFVGSDRSRVIIIPGNHDVNWSRASRAMTPINSCPDRIFEGGFQADSGVRWNWEEQRAYQITDSSIYQSRFDHFKKFQSEFYAGLDPSPLSHDESDLVFSRTCL